MTRQEVMDELGVAYETSLSSYSNTHAVVMALCARALCLALIMVAESVREEQPVDQEELDRRVKHG